MCEIWRQISKQLLRKWQTTLGDTFYAAPCRYLLTVYTVILSFSGVCTGYRTAIPDQTVRYRTRVKPRYGGLDYTVVCFVTHDCS